MNVSSTNGMLKLFAIELVVLVVIWYVLTIAVMDSVISLLTGLAIFTIVLLAEHAVEYFVPDT